MLAAGLIAKCCHQPHFHFKTNSPTSWGGAVCPLLHFMAPEFILRGGVRGESGGVLHTRSSQAFSHASPSALLSPSYHIIFRCGRANSGACSSHAALLTYFSSTGGAVMIVGIFASVQLEGGATCLIRVPLNSADLSTPTVPVSHPPYC